MNEKFLITYEENGTYRFFSEVNRNYLLELSTFGKKNLEVVTEDARVFINEDSLNRVSLAYLNIDTLNSVMLQRSPDNPVVYTDYTFDTETKVMTFNNPLEFDDVLYINYVTSDNFYVYYLATTDLQTVVLDIETQGRNVIELENINAVACDEKSFVIANDTMVPSNFTIENGHVKVSLTDSVPETIRIQLGYYESFPLVEGQDYTLIINGEEIELTCGVGNNVYFLGDYDYFMSAGQITPQPDAIVVEQIPTQIDALIEYSEEINQYRVVFDGVEYIICSRSLEETGSTVVSVAYIGNIYLYNQGENTGEPFCIVTKILSSADDELAYETWLYVEQTGEYSLLIESYDLIPLPDLAGAALVSFGRKEEENGVTKLVDNYGIGINSSDVNLTLPSRAISLFEAGLNTPTLEDKSKIRFNYRGILGTLPSAGRVGMSRDGLYHKYMVGTQGVFTDNMYIGDENRFLAFYTDTDDNNKKKLRLKASEVIFEGADGEDVNTKDSMVEVVITSSNGTVFKNHQGTTILTCTVYQGENNLSESQSVAIDYAWYKNNQLLGQTTRSITVNASDVDSKAVFTCKVIIRKP